MLPLRRADRRTTRPNFTTWDANGGGADHSQYSSLKQINKNNVKQLQVAWMYESGNNPTFNPVIVDGTMYVGAQNAVVALDAATGKEIWKHPGGGAARGITYWESKDRKDRRLLFANAGALTAIDARTGETILSFGDNGRTDLKNGLDREIPRVSSQQSRARFREHHIHVADAGESGRRLPGHARRRPRVRRRSRAN